MKLPCTILLVFTSFCILGCYPVYTTNNLPIQDQVLPIRDESNGDPIGDCIIIPLYVTTKGLSSGFGHGVGRSKDLAFLANPLHYVKNTKFKPVNGKAYGIVSLIGGCWIGKSTDIYALLVISPSYHPKLIWAVRTLDNRSEEYGLTPLSPEGPGQNEILMNFLSKDVIDDPAVCDLVGIPRATFSAFAPIEIHLTAAEKRTVQDYIMRADKGDFRKWRLRDVPNHRNLGRERNKTRERTVDDDYEGRDEF